MRTIWKFEVPIEDEFLLELPEGANILCVQTQENQALANLDEGCVWAIVNPEAAKVKRRFRIFGTGQPFPEKNSHLKYIGTFQVMSGRLVWHLFEDLSYEGVENG